MDTIENKKETPINSVFSFSIDIDTKYTVDGYLDIAREKIKNILSKRFNGLTVKHTIKEMVDRLNFACPYCGDSHSDPYKKRGNLYFEGFGYHCFNCNIHVSFDHFLKNFDEDVSYSELTFIIDETNKYKELTRHETLGSDIFFDVENINMWAIDRKELINIMGFEEIPGSLIEKYLQKRNQLRFHKFAWNQTTQKLALFNLTRDNKKVLGMQLRNFKSGHGEPKYLTFKLSKIYTDILKYEKLPEDPRFVYADEISTVFELANINITKDIYVFEGPMDSFLLKNAVALCTAGREFPFDMPVKWIYDDDKTGRKNAIKMLERGEPVFLWKKYLENIKFKVINNNKVDFNDIVNYAKKNNIKLPGINKYFSTDKYDLYWI